MLMAVSCFHVASCYSTKVAECGSPSRPSFTDGYECTGCPFTAVDINSFNVANTAAGCVSGLSGMYAGSTAAKGYHCLTVTSGAGSSVSCSVHEACGSKKATSNATKSCIYTLGGFSGIDDKGKCPEDKICSGSAASAAASKSSLSLVMLLLLVANFFVASSGYSTEVTECGSPSRPSFTDGYECTGCPFTAVDINSFNVANTAAGCVSGLSGMYAGSTAAKGYHCLTVTSNTNGGVSCSVHAACGSRNNTQGNTKSCIYTLGGFSGIDDKGKCPADQACASAASPRATSGIAFLFVFLINGLCKFFK